MIGKMPIEAFLYCMFLLAIALYMCWRMHKKEKGGTNEKMKRFQSAEVKKLANGFVMTIYYPLNHDERYYKTAKELLKVLENEITEDSS